MHSTIIIELSEEEIQRIMRIILDEDKEEALGFVKECLGKKIKQKTGPHCVPVFEASYKPGQKDQFTKK
ncbi:MAG: hypothetical protein Q8O04_11570 [Deltaproteobacteria bacterium]|nr:hypothetical protein [Deltaproteobacteria bacterium]